MISELSTERAFEKRNRYLSRHWPFIYLFLGVDCLNSISVLYANPLIDPYNQVNVVVQTAANEVLHF